MLEKGDRSASASTAEVLDTTGHFQTAFRSGEELYDALVGKVQSFVAGSLPVPADADRAIWVPVFSAHGSQPIFERSGEQNPTGVTWREAFTKVAEFAAAWDPFGGCGDVVRLSELPRRE